MRRLLRWLTAEDGWIVVLIFSLGSLAIFSILLGASLKADEAAAWERYATQHCKARGTISGDTSIGVGFGVAANGQPATVVTTSSTPAKTIWLCDDETTHIR